MNAFPGVTLVFQGKEYEVPSDRVWGLIGAIEEVISRPKLAMRIANNDPPETKIAEAYAVALRYAGARNVMPRDVILGGTYEDLLARAVELFNILNLAMSQCDVEGDGSGKPQARTTIGPVRRRTKSG